MLAIFIETPATWYRAIYFLRLQQISCCGSHIFHYKTWYKTQVKRSVTVEIELAWFWANVLKNYERTYELLIIHEYIFMFHLAPIMPYWGRNCFRPPWICTPVQDWFNCSILRTYLDFMLQSIPHHREAYVCTSVCWKCTGVLTCNRRTHNSDFTHK